MKKIFLTLIVLSATLTAFSQTGRDFWFAVPDITIADYGADNSIWLVFVTYDQPVNLHVMQPAETGGYFTPFDTLRTIPANSVWELDLREWKGQLEVMAGMNLPYALHMVGDNDFSVYYANKSNDSECIILKGKNALGTDFIVPMQYMYQNITYASNSNDAKSSIQVLAVEDNTTVNIEVFKWTTDIMQTAQHDTITVILNKGWAYNVQAQSTAGADHLHNSHVWSDKPIVVNSVDDGVAPSDMIADQLVPVALCGTSYIVVNNFSTIEEVYLFPVYDNTQIFIDGNLQTTLNQGDKYRFVLTTPVHYINSNKQFIAFQVTSIQRNANAGGAMLPKLECTGSMEAAYVKAFEDIYFNIVTKTAYINGFTLNGQSGIITASDFTTVPGHPEWAYCHKSLTNFANQSSKKLLRVKNSLGYFHVAAWDKREDSGTCSFGYFSDYHTIKFNTVSSKPTYTTGDIIHLTLGNADAFDNIIWTKPDGTTVSAAEIVINNPTAADAGMYFVNGTSKDGCAIEEEGVIVVNFFEPKDTFINLCSGTVLDLTSRGYAPYLWQPSGVTTQTNTVTPFVSTNYKVTNHQFGQNIIYNGNFQKGNTGFVSDYYYGGTGATALENVENYSVWRVAREVNADYARIYDHTLHDMTEGRYLVAHCSGVAGAKIWSKTIEVKPNTQYELAAYIQGAKRNADAALLNFVLNDVISGATMTAPNPSLSSNPNNWQQFSTLWNSGDHTRVTVSIAVAAGSPADAAVCIDDITFKPLLPVTDTFKITVSDCNVLEVEIAQTEYEICPTDVSDFSVDYQIIRGNVSSYALHFYNPAGQQIYTDSVVSPVGNTINIALAHLPSDIYTVKISFYGGSNQVSFTLKLTVLYDTEQFLIQKWNDVLALFNKNYNGGYEFSAVQWYKNGEPLAGENGSYLYTRNATLDFTAAYQALLTRADNGVAIFTCPYIPVLKNVDVTVSPTLVGAGEGITITAAAPAYRAKAVIYTLEGTVYSTQTVENLQSVIAAPTHSGYYVLCLETENESKKFKIFVH